MTVREALARRKGKWCVVRTLSGRLPCAARSTKKWYMGDFPYLSCEVVKIVKSSDFSPNGKMVDEIFCDYN